MSGPVLAGMHVYVTVVVAAVLLLCFAGNLVYQRIRTGSLEGAFYGGRVDQTLGSFQLLSHPAGLVKRRLEVVRLYSPNHDQRFVGLATHGQTATSRQTSYFRLSEDETAELIGHLERAVQAARVQQSH